MADERAFPLACRSSWSGSNPDDGAMSLFWVKHEASASWCRAVAVHDSVVTACRGRWPSTDDYTIDAAPNGRRCAECERSAIVERAIAAPGTAQDWDLSDPGDEG